MTSGMVKASDPNERLGMTKEVEHLRPYELAIREMDGRVAMGDSSAFEIGAQVADKILQAVTIEDVITAAMSSAGSIDDLVAKPFRFAGLLRYANAADQYKEGGTGKFVIFDIVDMNGEMSTYQTGAVNIVFQLKQFERLGYFMVESWVSDKVFTIKAKVTGSGNTLLRVDFA